MPVQHLPFENDVPSDGAVDAASSVARISNQASWYRVLRWSRPLLATGVLVAAAVSRPDRWFVEHVEFQGNLRATEAELRHLVSVQNGTSVWGVDVDAAALGVERHPWVKQARAWRRWPDSLVVQVEEYRPVAIVDLGVEAGGLHYVDANGSLFLAAHGEELDHPLIRGIQPSLGAGHPDIPRLALRDALHLLAILDEKALVLRDRVSSLDFSTTRGFTVHLRSGARVLFGLDDYDRQVQRLGVLIEQGVDLRQPMYVDLAPASLAIVRPIHVLGGNG